MKHSERIAPVAAVFTAAISICCCLPITIPAALGLAGLAMVVSGFQACLIGLSLMLLAIGLVQLYRNRSCQRRSRISMVLFCVAALIVLALALMPQTVAGILADRLG